MFAERVFENTHEFCVREVERVFVCVRFRMCVRVCVAFVFVCRVRKCSENTCSLHVSCKCVRGSSNIYIYIYIYIYSRYFTFIRGFLSGVFYLSPGVVLPMSVASRSGVAHQCCIPHLFLFAPPRVV